MKRFWYLLPDQITMGRTAAHANAGACGRAFWSSVEITSPEAAKNALMAFGCLYTNFATIVPVPPPIALSNEFVLYEGNPVRLRDIRYEQEEYGHWSPYVWRYWSETICGALIPEFIRPHPFPSLGGKVESKADTDGKFVEAISRIESSVSRIETAVEKVIKPPPAPVLPEPLPPAPPPLPPEPPKAPTPSIITATGEGALDGMFAGAFIVLSGKIAKEYKGYIPAWFRTATGQAVLPWLFCLCLYGLFTICPEIPGADFARTVVVRGIRGCATIMVAKTMPKINQIAESIVRCGKIPSIGE
jgi:hypothetical protein